MYGSLKSNGSCQQALLDPDHACTEDCLDLVEETVKKKSLKFTLPGSESPALSDTQRLLPPSNMSSSFKRRDDYVELEESRSYQSSHESEAVGINTDYRDYGGDPAFSIVDSKDGTADAIKQCEKFVLRPYKFFLRLIGWLPFGHSTCAKVAQGILVLVWTVAILVAMVTQILTCFKRDVFIQASSLMPASTNVTVPVAHHPLMCTDKIISSLILPDIVLLIAYFFGVYLFSKGETEYLFRLACHVFIKNSESGHVSYNKRLTRAIMFFLCAGLAWLFFSLGIRVMSAFGGDLFDSTLSVKWPGNVILGNGVRLFLVFFSLFGFFTFDFVYLFSVINYASQAEMNVFLLWDIASLIRAKKYNHIDGMIKDIHESQRYIKVLSRRSAILTALALFDLFTLLVNGLDDLERVNMNVNFRDHMFDLRTLSAVAAGLNCLCWVILIVVPFIQAARVTHAAELLKDVGPEVRARPYVYKMTPLLDLDSILSYLQTVKLRATIFGIPIYPWMGYATLVIFTFVLSILFQRHEFDSLSKII